MSVINRMLHDLDARGVRRPVTTTAANEPASLPVHPAHRLPDDHAWSSWRRTTLWSAVMALAVGTWVLGPPWIASVSQPGAERTAAAVASATATATAASPEHALPAAEHDAAVTPEAAAPADSAPRFSLDATLRRLPAVHGMAAPAQFAAGRTGIASERQAYVAPGLPPLPPHPSAKAGARLAAPNLLAANAAGDLFTLVAPPAAGRPAPAEATAAAVAAKGQGTPPQRASAALQRAQDLVDEGRAAEALDAARQAVRLDPSHAEARKLAVRLALETGDLAAAMALIDEGLQRHPNDAELGVLRARQLMAQGRPAEALAALQSLQQLSPEAHGLKAGLLANGGDYTRAIASYEQALRLRPSNATWWLGLGVALEKQGQAMQAREAYDRARALGTLRPDLAAWIEQKLQ